MGKWSQHKFLDPRAVGLNPVSSMVGLFFFLLVTAFFGLVFLAF